jgi:L,D-transpeptidase ErfK/SrfK
MAKFITCFFLFFFFNVSFALRLPLPTKDNDLCGKLTNTIVKPNETLASIARKYDLGYFELLEANPHVNPESLVPGTELVIPTQFLLPHAEHEDIVINLGTMRLYYFPKDKKYFYTYPVGIGKENWGTPLGTLSIHQKIKDPIWIVPKSIYQYRKKEDDPVAHVVQPGPDNPLGHYALRLSNPTYLIHGTNDPNSVGVRSSAGCIHLYPEDIKALFYMITLGEKVIIVNQPYLAGWKKKSLYVEAHLPLAEQRDKYKNIDERVKHFIIATNHINIHADEKITRDTLNDHLGIPLKIGSAQ